MVAGLLRNLLARHPTKSKRTNCDGSSISNSPSAARAKKLANTDWQISIESKTRRRAGLRSRSHPFNEVISDGYKFVNFDGPGAGTAAGAGTNMNGIANNGTVVGFGIDDDGNSTNFTANPLTSTSGNVLTSLAPNAMALGVNSAGSVVGADRMGNAFMISGGGSPVSFLPGSSTAATALGINDNGAIAGQMTLGAVTPGFVLNGDNLITVNAPNGASVNVVNAQGINNNGLVVGYYLGNDGQAHGFTGNIGSAVGGVLTGTALTDPVIPSIPGEPGATFMFSQVLGVNDNGIAVGYYGDSTASQHIAKGSDLGSSHLPKKACS
jgi:hypothetical protein